MEKEPKGQGAEALELTIRTRTPEATTLNAWLEQVESRWQHIPELEAAEGVVQHLAVLCDGNRRAARERSLNPYLGHQIGTEVIKGITRACQQWDIPNLTFWVWSTENWQRERDQIDFVMNLAGKHLVDPQFVEELKKGGVHFNHLGRKDRLPKAVVKGLVQLEEATADNHQRQLNLAMDYGGTDEMARAFTRMNEAIANGELDSNSLRDNPNIISNFLDTAGQPNPDLVIRTGTKEGKIPHTSGFMPLQTAYASWNFNQQLFPDLTPDGLKASLENFADYERRHGK